MKLTAVVVTAICIAMLLVSCMKMATPPPGAQTGGIEGIQWYLTEVGGSPVSPMADDKQPHILLDPAENQATGFAGCNNFFGRYELNGSLLTFGPMGATRMACPDLETGLEASVFEALEKTRKLKIEGGDLLLLDADAVLARFSQEKYISLVGSVLAAQSKDGATDVSQTYRTKTGKTIVVSQTHPAGRSIGTIEVRTEGFEHNYGEVFEDRDPISDVFTADLDGNGFDEIYIVTKAAGSGSYGTILGFASNKDKSLSMIHFPEVQEGDEAFEGYMGHDSFTIEGRKLVRIFPVYQEGDTSANPTDGRRKLVYGLVPGEAGWQLRVE
ncbi:MAG: META domain-containing protein [Deltaproteobacteria bacterium]|jgi:heat shock protein HslJ|nr:META domain-containing protein [Deltaproteobacteria bacterium]